MWHWKQSLIKVCSEFHRIQNLCSCWENALSHGLKTTSIFQNIVSGNLTTESTGPTFWEFAYQHLTGHEKERFSTLRYGLCFYIASGSTSLLNMCLISVYTDQGKTRALIRSALNERALERYISTWLGDTNGLFLRYESWALVRDNEASNLLPSMAAGESHWRHSNMVAINFGTNFVLFNRSGIHPICGDS